jgi:hypothetical protein
LARPQGEKKFDIQTIEEKTMYGFVRIAAVAFALAGAMEMSVATVNADVLRIAVVSADNKADYDNNVALLPGFAALLKKGSGVKGVFVGADPDKMSITTSSAWGSATDVSAVTDSADWKALAAKLKAKTYTTEVFEIVP